MRVNTFTPLTKGSNNGKVEWEGGWTWVRSTTEARGLSVTSEEEGGLFGRVTVTPLWHWGTFLMVNFKKLALQQSMLFVPLQLMALFKEHPGPRK